jgi:hypothetical protein
MRTVPLKVIPRPLAIETRLVLSMLYQVKDRLEIKRWMKPQDIIEAHQNIFKRIDKACSADYGHPATPMHHLKAVELLMEGFNREDIL